jgi:hypothetical protein
MTNRRQAARVDENQADIVAGLRAMPGVSVSVGHDDILVGHKGQTYWFEIKRPDQRKQDGTWRAGSIKLNQIKLAKEWQGHYEIVSDIGEIAARIGRT